MERSPDLVLDELLVLGAQDGDIEALSSLIRRWQPRLYRHALHLTGRHDAAADVVQESWLSAARTIRRLQDPACFPRWVFQIVSHKSVDWIRNEKRHRSIVDRQVAANEIPAVSSTDQAAATNTDLDQLRSALHRLPPDRRELLSLYYLDALPIAEIAKILTIPSGTVKSKLHYARQELKQLLERSEP